MIRSFFKTDESYRGQVAEYKRKDAVTAIIVWLAIMVTYYLMGQLYAQKGVYIGIPVNIFLACLCIALVLIKKEKLTTLGFTKNNAVKAIVLGSILGFLVVAVNSGVNIFTGHRLAKFQNIAINFFYYMLVISLVEEVIFRGYIQTRIYGLIKRPFFAIIVGGILFMLMHIPFQMGHAKMGLFDYIEWNWISLLSTFFWHVVFDFLYRKYNSINTSTIFHGLMDWANYLFI